MTLEKLELAIKTGATELSREIREYIQRHGYDAAVEEYTQPIVNYYTTRVSLEGVGDLTYKSSLDRLEKMING